MKTIFTFGLYDELLRLKLLVFPQRII